MTDPSIQPPTAGAPRGLIGFAESHADEVFAFQRVAFPTRRDDWVEPRWRWMFLQSAARLGVQPMVWFFRRADGIVGQQGAIPVRVQIDGDERLTGWFVETMVLESVRGKAVGPMLVAKAREDLPFNLSLGQTPEMRELQFRLGWRQLAPLSTYAYIVNGREVVRGKVMSGLERVAGALLEFRQWARRRAVRVPRGRFDVRAVERFDARSDELWARLRPFYPCAVVRDASYLNWKYCDQPGQAFTRIEIRESGRLEGVVVFKTVEPEAPYAYRRVLPVELIVSPARPELVAFLLDVLCAEARSAGGSLITFDLLHRELEEELLRFGFAKREPSRFFLISTASLPDHVTEAAADADKWLLTRGDSDIDRPW